MMIPDEWGDNHRLIKTEKAWADSGKKGSGLGCSGNWTDMAFKVYGSRTDQITLIVGLLQRRRRL